MAFSGQYAAAQLAKLHHSPLFRGYTFPLAQELSAWLGYAPDFAPPTYLTFARVHRRIPSVNGGDTRAAYAQVLDHDVHNYERYTMHANISRFDDDRIRIDYIIGTLAELRELRRAGDGPCYCFVVELLRSTEDIDFFVQWRAAHGEDWPYTTGSFHLHPVLHGAHRAHWGYYRAWNRARERQMARVMQYNAA